MATQVPKTPAIDDIPTRVALLRVAICALLGFAYGGTYLFAEVLLLGPLLIPEVVSVLLTITKDLVFLSLLLTVPTASIALVGIMFKTTRAASIQFFTFALVGVLTLIPSARASVHVRDRAFTALAERSKPLVAAIHAFEREHGHPPPTLKALVPDYLPEVPRTDMAEIPDYYYSPRSLKYRPTGTWYLGMHTSDSVMDFDEFFYEPTGRFDGANPSNYYERFGDWVYMHD